MVYARPDSKDTGEPLTFGVSGRLWRDTLIMFDRETRSLWSQLKGEAVHGEMKGRDLPKIPSVRTTWGEWKRLHPNTLALAKPAEIASSPYQSYFESSDRMGISGRDLADDRLPGKALVYGLEDGGEAVAVPLSPEVRDVVRVKPADEEILVVRDGERAASWKAEGRRLRWAEDAEELRAEDAPGRWDPWSGAALEEGLEDLEPAAGVSTYWFTWSAYYPKTRIRDESSAHRSPPVQTRPQSRPQSRPRRR